MKSAGLALLVVCAPIACAALVQGRPVTVTKPAGGCDVRLPQAFTVPETDDAFARTRYATVTCTARLPVAGAWHDYWTVRVLGVEETRLIHTPAEMRRDSAIDAATDEARYVARELLARSRQRCDSIIILPLPPGMTRRFCA